MVTNNKAVQAINAPATSKSMTTVILKEVINNAPKAGPAILQTDCIAWFTPDIRINSVSGANKGIAACMAGE